MTVLLVASNGGHLKQLYRLHRHFGDLRPPYRWVTFDTPQARSMLKAERVDYVPHVGGRDPINVLRNVRHANSIICKHRPDAMVSTGSAIALPFFSVGRARGVSCHFVESAARMQGPSLTGRLMQGVPGVRLYSQYRQWAGGRWTYRGSVFEAFEAEVEGAANVEEVGRVVVALGTYHGITFRRLVDRVLQILPEGAEVLWQTGFTDVSDLDIDARAEMPEEALIDAMAEADVVIAHAGVGTALAALEVGKRPVLVPRRVAFGEHVDDHQVQIASELAGRGLARWAEADTLDLEDLLDAASSQIIAREGSSTFATD
jgi:UDP-N-acetylglucosamine--N-acetylmuramyl-(pentapeptide) pyrophosphoryl-undecaprenol N-acetylglucosamine transferase